MNNRASTGKPVSETANNLVGDRVAWWLKLAYRDSVAKRAAQQFAVSEGTAKRWKRGIAPTSEHLAAMAKAFGWRFVEFIYSPVCAGPDYDSRLSADILQLKQRIARLEDTKNEGSAAGDQGRSDAAGGNRNLSRGEAEQRLWAAQQRELERTAAMRKAIGGPR
jgi:hypothetical protein